MNDFLPGRGIPTLKTHSSTQAPATVAREQACASRSLGELVKLQERPEPLRKRRSIAHLGPGPTILDLRNTERRKR